MGLALYRKYRPKGLEDVVGQDHIVQTLRNALKSGKISHAYLFTGPRGVGKTSVARILAHEINGLPYADDSIHLDIIEIDAASNRRIDEIRDLRDKVHIAPTSAKYKVYIIDEVHMLTREAFNALLKTLEEPPAHVVFILATTEAHKVPDTIASRTQRFSFKPINGADTVKLLRELSTQEGITISDDALAALADHAGGSFRDSINLLDQMIGSADSIEKSDIEAMLGLPNPLVISGLFEAVQTGNISELTQTLAEARVSGIHAGLLAKALGEQFRTHIINSGEAPDTRTTALLRSLLQAAGERDAFAALELALFEYTAVATTPVQLFPAAVPVVVPTPVVKREAPLAATPVVPVAPVPLAEPEPTALEANAVPAELRAPLAAEAFWTELLTAIKKTHNTLYSVLRMASPHLENDELLLVFNFAFHQKQMSQAVVQQRIADTATALLGRSISVKSIHQKTGTVQVEKPRAKAAEASASATTPPTPSSLTDVNSIFKGAELLG